MGMRSGPLARPSALGMAPNVGHPPPPKVDVPHRFGGVAVRTVAPSVSVRIRIENFAALSSSLVLSEA